MPARKIRQVISPTAFPTYKNVGVYCRVSTGSMPQLHSLAEQVSYYVQMLRTRPPYKLYDIYIDVCSGAKNLERVQYQRMLQDCRAGKIEIKTADITCPDHTCSKMGKISFTYTPIVCLPNQIQAMIVAESLPEWDA